jgi:hypothetical protein
VDVINFENMWGSKWEKISTASACIKDTTPPQPNHTVTPTHIKPEQYTTHEINPQ